MLDVQILDVQRIVFDKLAPLLDIFAHQRGEYLLGFHKVFQLHLKQRAPLGVHGGLPKLRGSHLAQSLVALDLIVLFSLLDNVGEKLAGGLLFHRLTQGAAGSAR